MALSTSEKNALATKFATDALFASLHSADPGTSGTVAELSGGTPGYARKGLTWGSAASGVVSTTSAVTFDVPAAVTVAYVAFWTASTGGTFLGSQQVVAEAYTGQGTYSLTSVTYTQS